MFDLAHFGLSDTFEVSAAVRQLAEGAADLRELADRLVRYFQEGAVDKATGEPSLALVRCLASTTHEQLPPDLQDHAAGSTPHLTVHPRQLCLTLLAAAGERQVLEDERIVRALTTVPLPSEAADGFAPLCAHVAQQLQAGQDAGGVLRHVGPSHVVAHVPDARRHPLLAPWSGVLLAHGIRSVLSVSARLSGDTMVTLVLFGKAEIPARTADAFTAVGIGLKLAVLPLAERGLLAPRAGQVPLSPQQEIALLRAEKEAMGELLRARHDIALDLSGELEQALQLAESRAAELAASRTALDLSEARASAIVRTALDAVIVMDANGRVVDWNQSAEATFGWTREEALGQPVSELVVPHELRQRHVQGVRTYLETGEGPLLGTRVEITAVRRDGTSVPVELSITPVPSADGETVFTGFVRDITERRQQRAELISSRENFAHIARTLQRSLLPSALPDVPGVDLGAAFHPSRAGSDVGGDFYDVFRVGRTDLVLTLGDVCGKGPEAAAITSIARHTVRAVAPDLRHPSAILRRLNSALGDQDIGERFCSIVAVRAVPIVRGLRLSVCCAGHAAPMVLRADGTLERVGVAGDLLGLFSEVRLFEETVQLGLGDTLVMFTDGVTEARRAGEELGERGLARLLTEAVGGTGQQLVDHVLDGVLAFGGDQSRDDIAVLAVQASPRQPTS